jgi:hypothetical protein
MSEVATTTPDAVASPSPVVAPTPAQVESKRQEDKQVRISKAVAALEGSAPAPKVEEAQQKVEEVAKVEEPKKEEEAPKKETPKVAALRKREEALAAKESAIAAQEKNAADVLRAIQNFKKDPMTALKAAGMTFQDLADVVIAQSKIPDPVKQQMSELESRLEALTNSKAEEEKQRKEAEALKEEEFIKTALNDFDKRLATYLDANKNDYELILATDNRGLVNEIMQEYYNEHGQFLDAIVACKTAEKYLEERLEKASKTKKFTSKFAQQSTPKEQKTLFSSMGSGSTSINDGKPLSERERLARAASLIRFDD